NVITGGESCRKVLRESRLLPHVGHAIGLPSLGPIMRLELGATGRLGAGRPFYFAVSLRAFFLPPASSWRTLASQPRASQRSRVSGGAISSGYHPLPRISSSSSSCRPCPIPIMLRAH